MNIIGDVAGKCCIMVDDIVDSAGTLCNAAVALKDTLQSRLLHMSHMGFCQEVPSQG